MLFVLDDLSMPPREKRRSPEIERRLAFAGTPASLAAADDKLFLSTREGHVHCFGVRRAGLHRVHARPDAELRKTATATGSRSKVLTRHCIGGRFKR